MLRGPEICRNANVCKEAHCEREEEEKSAAFNRLKYPYRGRLDPLFKWAGGGWNDVGARSLRRMRVHLMIGGNVVGYTL